MHIYEYLTSIHILLVHYTQRDTHTFELSKNNSAPLFTRSQVILMSFFPLICPERVLEKQSSTFGNTYQLCECQAMTLQLNILGLAYSLHGIYLLL